MKSLRLAVLAFLLVALSPTRAHAIDALVDKINPLIGASTSTDLGEGKTFPGAATPFGLVQLSPDTITGGDNGPGYSYEHTSIEGFSFAHMSGIGWYGDLGNLLVMPTTGPLKTERGDHGGGDGYRSKFHHETETAQAGYYAVTLDDYSIRAEMTAAPRAGILRFTFPQSSQSRIQIDLSRRIGGTSTRQHVKIIDDHTIEGWMKCPPEGGGWGKWRWQSELHRLLLRPIQQTNHAQRRVDGRDSRRLVTQARGHRKPPLSRRGGQGENSRWLQGNGGRPSWFLF